MRNEEEAKSDVEGDGGASEGVSELSAMTYSVGGRTLTLAQIQAEQAEQQQRLDEAAAEDRADNEARRAQREEDAKNGIHY